MSLFQPNMSSLGSNNSSFDERKWVIHISQSLEDELEDEESELPVSIFNVPKALMATDPDCYVPQVVAIGPYHFRSPELSEMQPYKLAAAKRTQKQLQNRKFQHLVDKLNKSEPKTRACYHKYLSFSGETLGWMMAVDACFLLEFLRAYNTDQVAAGNTTTFHWLPSRMGHLIDVSGRKSTHNAILRDIVKLKNQIPLFILRNVLDFQVSSLELADPILLSMLSGVLTEVSPFKIPEKFSGDKIAECAHLLDFLYHFTVHGLEDLSETVDIEEEEQNEVSEKKSSHVTKFSHEVWRIISKLSAIFSKPLKLMLRLPWTIITTQPVLRILKEHVESLFCGQDKEDEKSEDGKSASKDGSGKPPLMEEIAIPSVVELSEAGVRFSPTDGGISSIGFDEKTVTLYLPTIRLDVNSEVILRNLVAYEACNASGPLVLARYTELMNGIIDTEEDATFLRQKGIILSRLKRDEEVAELWNGMNRSVKLTKVPLLDKVIEDVNECYNGRRTVRVKRLLKVYVFGSWKILTLLATIILLLLMTLEAFCTVYSCPRMFHTIDEYP